MTSTSPLSCRVVAPSPEAEALVRDAISLVLPSARLGDDAEPPGAEALARARDELQKAQRLHAAGEIALGLQHAMNNPLTAILAEAQLLAMETLPEEMQGAVGRIVENTRRLVALVRRLDAVAPK